MSDPNKQLNTIDINYLYKKTEKLVSALYLLTSFISDKEPVKWQLREAGLKLLAQNLPLSDRSLQGVSLVTLILSLLGVSYLGGIISEMNYNILKAEFESLIKAVETEEAERMKGAILSNHFFEPSIASPGYNPKGQNIMSDRATRPIATPAVKKEGKTNRHDIILSLLKSRSDLGIKDFVSSIKGCSEKTIQRELMLLVSKGQIKKQGEKRWSRYSLK